jgi:hypothetical protein
MALAKKGSRLIRVGGRSYRWVASPDSGYITLVVESAAKRGQRLTARFPYCDVRLEPAVGPLVLIQRSIVTPGLVRRSILEGLAQGWKPDESGRDFTATVRGDDLLLKSHEWR